MVKVNFEHKAAQVDNQEDSPSFDASILPFNNSPSVERLHGMIVTGNEAVQTMSKIMQPQIGMYLNEITPAGVVVTRPEIRSVYPFKAFAKHNLAPSSENHTVLEGHIRSRSGRLEYNSLTNILEDGTIQPFIPLRVRPFEKQTAFDTPRYSVTNNGLIQVEKTYLVQVRYQWNDPETGETNWDEMAMYLCPAMEAPEDREFQPLGALLGIDTVHADVPEASGEGATTTAKTSRSRAKVNNAEAAGSDEPVSLE